MTVQRSPEVSVVVPTRNRWDMLSTAALPAALSQQGVEVEVIVVDDGSTDGTAARVAALGDPRIRVLRHERTCGVAGARNRGIAKARGEWVAFLDDDDLWSPLKLRTQLDAVASADVSFVYSAVVSIDLDRRVIAALDLAEPEGIAAQLLTRNVLNAGASNVVAKAAILRELGGFDENLACIEDWDLWIRLGLAGKAACSPEVLVAYVEHGGNAVVASRGDHLSQFEYLTVKHRAACVAHSVNFDRESFTRWVAFGHWRAGRRRQAARTFLAHPTIGNIALSLAVLPGKRAVALGQRSLSLAAAGRSRSDALSAAAPDWLDLYR